MVDVILVIGDYAKTDPIRNALSEAGCNVSFITYPSGRMPESLFALDGDKSHLQGILPPGTFGLVDAVLLAGKEKILIASRKPDTGSYVEKFSILKINSSPQAILNSLKQLLSEMKESLKTVSRGREREALGNGPGPGKPKINRHPIAL